jgi:hypothetical protein
MEGKGLKRQLTSSKDQVGWGFATLKKGLPFQVRVYLFLYITCARDGIIHKMYMRAW